MSLRFLSMCAIVLVLCTCGCGDDPAEPGDTGDTELWTAVPLPAPTGSLELFAVAAAGAQVAAIGWHVPASKDLAGSSILFQLGQDGSWDATEPAPGSPSATWLDLAVDPVGGVVLVGFESPGSLDGACIMDDRDGSGGQTCFPALGAWSIDGDDGLYVAGGVSTGGELWTSRVAGQWEADDLPLTGTDDSGFPDVDVRGEVTVACGYDDGADQLAVILIRTGLGPWTHLDLPEPGFFGRTLQAVALTADGAVYVGGITGAGGLDPRAFLAKRSVAGDWTDVALPDPAALGGINDILLAADGTVYLACGGESRSGLTRIAHATGTEVTVETTPFVGQLHSLAQGGDGALYAAGYRGDRGPDPEPVLFRRNP